jgi:hypothetical protein
MALQLTEQYVMVVNSDSKPKRLHDRFFPRGYIDIPPVSECPEGVSVPARLFKRNCIKYWLWRAGCEPKPNGAEPADAMTMAEIREAAAERGITIPFGTKKSEALELLKGDDNDETS